jgi:hypothetical protein
MSSAQAANCQMPHFMSGRRSRKWWVAGVRKMWTRSTRVKIWGPIQMMLEGMDLEGAVAMPRPKILILHLLHSINISHLGTSSYVYFRGEVRLAFTPTHTRCSYARCCKQA